jgi:hypothetical protein
MTGREVLVISLYLSVPLNHEIPVFMKRGKSKPVI